jgi:hypothetical protein
MELALGSWPWSPVLKVNTSWIFVFFFALFKLIYFNFIIQIFFPTFLSMRLSQSYAYDRGLCEFTWFNMVLLLFFKNCFFFTVSFFNIWLFGNPDGLRSGSFTNFSLFFLSVYLLLLLFFCSYYLNYWLNQWLRSQMFLPYHSFFT